MKKPKKQTYDVWIKRTHTFTANIEAGSIDEAFTKAQGMSEDTLLDAPGDNIDSEFEITGVLKA